MNAKIASFFLVLLCTVTAHAVNVRFLAWDDSVAAKKISIVRGDKGDLIRDLHPLKRTGNYPGGDEKNPMKLRLDGRKNPDGTPADLEVKLEGIAKPLVLVIANDKAPSGLASVVINDDESNFKWGSYQIFNATPGDIALVVDKVAVKIPTGWKPVPITPKGTNKAASIEMRTYKDPSKVVYSAVWPAEPDARLLIILSPSTDARLGPISTKTVPETKAIMAAEAEQERSRAGNNNGGATPPAPH